MDVAAVKKGRGMSGDDGTMPGPLVIVLVHARDEGGQQYGGTRGKVQQRVSPSTIS